MYSRDIMEGLKFLHTASPRAIVHRDIKPANVLLTLDGRCKLADFGCIAILESPQSDFIAGTRLYAPPEMIDGEGPITPAFDVWSLAVTIHRMLTNEHPWPAKYVANPRQLIEYHREIVKHGLPELDHPLLASGAGHQAADLIASVLVAAEERPSIEELEAHPFFKREYEGPIDDGTPEEAARCAALDKLTLIRQGRAVSVTVHPDQGDESASLFEGTPSWKRRARLRPEDRPSIEDIDTAYTYETCRSYTAHTTDNASHTIEMPRTMLARIGSC